MKNSNIFLSNRQIEILKFRKQGLTQKEIATRLKTTRENVSILENRAHRNIKRALATIEILNRLELAIKLTIEPGTYILDVPKLILDRADESSIKLNYDCVNILEKIKLHCRIEGKHTVEPITVMILPDGNVTVE